MQFSVLSLVAGTLVLGAFFAAVAALVLPHGVAAEGLTPKEVTALVIRVLGVYFLFTMGTLVWFAVRWTHRVAGPAQVLEKAVRALGDGDLDARTKLRKKDYLQGLAEAVRLHVENLRAERSARADVLERLAGTLEVRDFESAKALVRELAAVDGHDSAPDSADETAEDPAERETVRTETATT